MKTSKIQVGGITYNFEDTTTKENLEKEIQRAKKEESGLGIRIDQLKSETINNSFQLSILTGTGEGSVTKQIDDAITEKTNVDPEIFNTIQGISDWIENDKTGSADLISDVEKLEKNKAEKDGYYTNLTAGHSDNLVGRGESTESTFIYRASDGLRSIDDGTAKVKKIKGNSIVYNQLLGDFNSSNWRPNYVNAVVEDNGKSVTIHQTTDQSSDNPYYDHTYVNSSVGFSRNKIGGHKCLLLGTITLLDDIDNINNFIGIGWYGTQELSAYTMDIAKYLQKGYPKTVYYFATVRGDEDADHVIRLRNQNLNTRVKFSNVQLFDLTLMFGAGNEPTTFDEFKSYLPETYYPQSYGELISSFPEQIKTIGFNQWDEKWINGYYSVTTGELMSDKDKTRICSANPIYLLSNVKYYCKSSATTWGVFYTSDNRIYSHVQINDRDFTVPENVRYMKFYVQPDYGGTYNGDICINIQHTNYRNGEYQPHENYSRTLPIKKYFPDGLKRAGSVYDEITPTCAIKRVGVIDLGDIVWNKFNTQEEGKYRFISSKQVENLKKSVHRTSSDYANFSTTSLNLSIIGAGHTWQPISEGIGYSTEDYLFYLYSDDLNSKTADEIKTLMAGHKLYYELKEPEIIEFPEPLNLDYVVWDFGTEEIKSSELSAPLKADIVYGFNAVDTIRSNRNSIEEVRGEFIDKLMSGLNCTSYSDLSNKILELFNSIPTVTYDDGSANSVSVLYDDSSEPEEITGEE